MTSARPLLARISTALALALGGGLAGTAYASALPAAEQPAPASIAGEYRGTIANQRFIVTLAQADDGALSGTLSVPDQGNVALPFDSVTFTRGVVHLELKAAGASYQGTLSDSGDSIAGVWSQGGHDIPLVLRRPGTAAAFTLSPRTIGSVAFQPCLSNDGNTEGLCGTYDVYENRARKTGRKLKLKIMVLPALSGHAAPDAFLPLAGGPGESAIGAFPLAAYTGLIRKDHDVVLIDQRGTGGSAPLQCALRDPQNVQQAIGGDIPPERVKACRDQLSRNADLTQYTTSIFADDLDEVRAALGYAQVDVFGGSYGSRAALDYLRRHGDHVRTLTLESIVAPDYRIPLSFSPAIQGSIDRVIARCDADADCHKAYPNLGAEFHTVLDRLDTAPVTMTLPVPAGSQTLILSKGLFVSGLRPVLYFPEAIRAFPMIVHNAYNGDFKLYLAAVSQMRGAIDGSVNRNLFFSVVCAEDMPATSPEGVHRVADGTYVGDFPVRQYRQVCSAWPQGAAPADFWTPIRSKVPALLMSGALDPATPPEMAADLARGLPNSQVVTLANGSHVTGSPCIDRMIAQFVTTAAKVDTACVASIQLPPFLVP